MISFDALQIALRPFRRAISNIVGRGVLAKINDAPKMQEVQANFLSGETRGRAERFQNFGFRSVPNVGAEAVAVFPGGDRSAPIVIVVDDRRYRFVPMAEGEVAMYNEHGDHVWFRQNRDLEVVTSTKVKVTAPDVHVVASTKVKLETPLVEVTGNVTVDGTIQCDGNITSGATITATTNVVGGGKSLNSHTHTGVTAGGGVSGPPS